MEPSDAQDRDDETTTDAAPEGDTPPPSRRRGKKKKPRPEAPPVEAPRKAAPPRKGWPKEVVVLGMVLSGLAGALVVNTAPQWSTSAAGALGQTQTVELTLVATDRENLACASAAVVDGLKCAFGADGKPWPAGAGPSAPSAKLQPYTTTDRKHLLGAGLWDDPALEKGKLPSTRFRVRCDFAPVGEAVAQVRWSPGPFEDGGGAWRAGRLSKCTVLDG